MFDASVCELDGSKCDLSPLRRPSGTFRGLRTTKENTVEGEGGISFGIVLAPLLDLLSGVCDFAGFGQLTQPRCELTSTA